MHTMSIIALGTHNCRFSALPRQLLQVAHRFIAAAICCGPHRILSCSARQTLLTTFSIDKPLLSLIICTNRAIGTPPGGGNV